MSTYLAVGRLAVCAGCLCSCSGSPQPVLVAHSHCGPVDTLELAPVQVAQSARRIVYFTNPGDTDASGLSATIAGPDASSFKATADSKHVPPGGIGIVTIDMTANGTLGYKHAELHFGGVSLELVGHEVAPTTGLLSTSANIEFLTAGGGYSQQLNLSNQSSTMLGLTEVTADTDGLFANAYYHYISSLPPFGQGQVNVDLADSTAGCGSGVLHLHTDQGSVDVPVSGEYVPIAHVSVSGDGHGEVTSTPAALSCTSHGGVCDALAPATSFTLTASPEGGDHFNGWVSEPCGTDPVCTLTTGPLERLNAQAVFASSADKPIHITIAGGGAGLVRLAGAITVPCRGSCTVYVPGGGLDPVQLVAMPFSQFAGWSGDCSGSQTTCNVSVLTGGDNVTATFDPDPNEAGSRILPATYAGIVATLSNGDLITLGNAAGLTRLSRLEADGTVVWTRPLLYSSFGMVTSAGGTIYVTGQIAIYALDSDGKLLWSMPSAPPTHVIATFGEDVVAAAQTSTSVYSALDGSLEWSVPFVPQAVAASSNVLAMAAGNTIHRYAPDGTELLPSWTVPGGDGASSMSFDPAGNLVILGGANENGGTVSGPPTLSKLSPDGAVVFSSLLDSSGNVGSGQVLALASGQVAALREHFGGLDSSTLDQVELYDASGARQWWVQKGVGWTTGDTYQPFGFSAQLLAGPGPGFRVLGSYFSGDQVLETFTP